MSAAVPLYSLIIPLASKVCRNRRSKILYTNHRMKRIEYESYLLSICKEEFLRHWEGCECFKYIRISYANAHSSLHPLESYSAGGR